MALVICDMSISLDGYVTGPNDSRENPFGDGAGMLHDWMFGAATDGDRAIRPTGTGPSWMSSSLARARL
jgi:hypothetical protein